MRYWFAVSAIVFVAASPAPAAEGTVAGAGSVELGMPATMLRVRVELMGRGRDVKDALYKLQERRDAAKKLFASLNITPASLTFTEPGLSAEKTQRQQEMERMLGRLRQARGAKAEAAGKVQVPVFVASTLQADIPLKTGNTEELLAQSLTLQEKIRAADLGGLKDEEKRTPQEEELLEEMGGRELPETGEPKRGEPVFIYLAPVAEAEREKALAEAFQKAKRDAARLAKAAGGTLGGVMTLSESSQPGLDTDDPPGAAQRFLYTRGASNGFEDNRNEAIGYQPGRVVLRFAVNAQFKFLGGEK